MDSIVIREGKKVNLCIISRDHLGDIQKCINDFEVNRYLRNPASLYYSEDEHDWYESLRKNKGTDRVLAIVPNDETRIAGVVGLHHFDPVGRHAELGYFVCRDQWNRGIAGEAVSLMVKYGKDAWNLRKVYAFVRDGNEASFRVLEKNGFERCGAFREHDYSPGEGFVDLVMYERMI